MVEQTPAIRPQSFLELERFAQLAAKSSFVPRDYQNRPDNIMVAIQMGSELGLAPMQALQNISVINGRPSVWGDAMLALCRRSPLCEDVAETIEGEGEHMAAICVARRRGSKPVVHRFSVTDAKQANLWGKQGPWQQYPRRMLQMRARGFALRDAFPDLLRGLISAEEASDMPTIEGELAEDNPAPKAAPQRKREEMPPKEKPAANDWQKDARAQKVAEWMRARQAELRAAQSEAAIGLLVDTHEKAAKRLTAKEYQDYLETVTAAYGRVKEARGEGAFDAAEQLLEQIAGYDLVTLSRLHEDKWWREAYNNLDENDQERVADAVEERKRALKQTGKGGATTPPGPQA